MTDRFYLFAIPSDFRNDIHLFSTHQNLFTGVKWRNLPWEEKLVYVKKQNEMYDEYMKKFPNYRPGTLNKPNRKRKVSPVKNATAAPKKVRF